MLVEGLKVKVLGAHPSGASPRDLQKSPETCVLFLFICSALGFINNILKDIQNWSGKMAQQ